MSERDLTTGQSGFMIASETNGFMHTSPADCSGTPFNFRPEYSSAAASNILPWGAGPYNVNTQFEIGHFEACTSVTDPQPFSASFHDTFWSNCRGPYETGTENADPRHRAERLAVLSGRRHARRDGPTEPRERLPRVLQRGRRPRL